METTLNSAILQAWCCALGPKKIVYLSGPITTGRAFVDSICLGNSIDDDFLLRQNSEKLIATANELRSQLKEPVLEPASLHILGWSQTDYLNLWVECIRRHAHTVMFMPDWEYSVGCITEFSFARSIGIRTLKIDGSEMTDFEAFSLMENARLRLEPLRENARLNLFYLAIESALSRLSETEKTE